MKILFCSILALTFTPKVLAQNLLYDQNGIRFSYTESVTKTKTCNDSEYKLVLYKFKLYNYGDQEVKLDYTFFCNTSNTTHLSKCMTDEGKSILPDLVHPTSSSAILVLKPGGLQAGAIGNWVDEDYTPGWNLTLLNSKTVSNSLPEVKNSQPPTKAANTHPKQSFQIDQSSDVRIMTSPEPNKNAINQQTLKKRNDSIASVILFETHQTKQLNNQNNRQNSAPTTTQRIDQSAIERQRMEEMVDRTVRNSQMNNESNQVIINSITDAGDIIKAGFESAEDEREQRKFERENELARKRGNSSNQYYSQPRMQSAKSNNLSDEAFIDLFSSENLMEQAFLDDHVGLLELTTINYGFFNNSTDTIYFIKNVVIELAGIKPETLKTFAHSDSEVFFDFSCYGFCVTIKYSDNRFHTLRQSSWNTLIEAAYADSILQKFRELNMRYQK